MNREIKFRVWDHQDKCFDSDFWLYQTGALDHDSKILHGEFSIQQYTGLKDILDKEVYEGDIISCFENMHDGMSPFPRPIAVVMYDGCCFCYSLDKTRNYRNPHQILRYAINPEVIGNIFENPELLNQ